jgi:thioredoxin 1
MSAGSKDAEICRPGEFDKAVAKGPVLAEFRQDQCGACKIADRDIMPKIEGAKVRVTIGASKDCENLADRFKINATPTFLVFKDGKETWRYEGVTKVDRDLAEIRKHLSVAA